MATRTDGQNVVEGQYRNTRAGGSGEGNTAGAPGYPNCWLRVERFGPTFKMYYSTNGTTWRLFDTYNTSSTDRGFGTAWPITVNVGVAVTAHNNGSATLGVATVSDLSITVHPVTPPTSITITKQVQSTSAYEGTEGSFSIDTTNNASPAGLFFPTYQWYRNNQMVTNATGKNFTYLTWPFENGDQVYCVASFADLGVSATSATGTLTMVSGSVYHTNGLKVELFRGASRQDVNVGNTATTVPNKISSFDIAGGFGDNYSQRVSGWFKAPSSANYTFFVASDDDCDVFLSTDANPANKRMIAQETAWSGYRKYTTGAGGSDWNQKTSDLWTPDIAVPPPYAGGIPLVQGNLYYLEATMHQGGGGDNLSVTYIITGSGEAVDDQPSKLSEANGNLVLITTPTTNLVWTTQPTNTTLFEGQTVTFRSLASSSTELALLYQWYRNNTPINGATAPNYGFTTTALDNGAQFYVVARTQEGGLAITSSIVTLTVQQSVFEPGYAKVEFWEGKTRAQVEAGTAGDPTYVTTSPAFEAGINNESGNSYARRLTGLFVPPTTTRYDFFVNTDDGGDLFVGTSASVASKALVAQETSWSNPRQWATASSGITSQKRSDTWTNATSGGVAPYAAGIQMTAGQKYYMEVVQGETGGGDNAGATYKVHGGTDPVNGAPSILTGNVIGINAIRCGYVAFTQQPSSVTNEVMTSATFTAQGVTDSTMPVGVIGDPRPYVNTPVYVIYQWYKNGSAIPGAISSTYTTPPLLPTDSGAQYMVKIRALGLADAALNPIWSNSAVATLTMLPSVWEPGYAKVDYWAGKSRNDVETGAAGTPGYQTAVAQFGVTQDVADNYSRRFSGFFMPPTTENYVMFINADDDADLFLNPSGMSPDGKRLVAQETQWGSGRLNWTSTSGNAGQLRSDTFTDPTTGTQPWAYPGIPLTGGQKYYLEGVQHEGSGGDYFGATFSPYNDAWMITDGTPIALKGATIGMYVTKCSYVAFTQQPQSVTVPSLTPATFTAAGTSDAKLSISPNGAPTLNNFMLYQWYKNSSPIPGATTATLTIAEALPGDNGAQIVCAIRALGYGDAGGNAIWSNSVAATLNVTTVPAVFNYAAYVQNTNLGPGVAYVALAFDKHMDPTTVGNAANYTLAGGLTKTGVVLVNSNDYRHVAIFVTGTFGSGATVTMNNLRDAANQPVASGQTAPIHSIPLTTSDVGTPGTDPIFPSMLWVDGARDYTIVAEGSDFWGNADGGNLSWELKSGNFDVVVRVKSVSYTSTWAKGGLMARDTLDAGSRNWNIVCDPTQGANAIEANSRTALNGGSAGFDGARPAPAYPNAWVRLAREGNIIRAYYSTNGMTWTLTGTQTSTAVGDATPLPASMYVGICATAHNNDVPGVEPYQYWNTVPFADYNSAYVPAVPVTLSIVIAGSNAQVTRTPNAGTLYQSPTLGPSAVWTPAPAGNPASIPLSSGQTLFFKVMP